MEVLRTVLATDPAVLRSFFPMLAEIKRVAAEGSPNCVKALNAVWAARRSEI
jgi:hypothetical protein